MRSLKFSLTIVLLVGLVAGVTGCGSDDDNPAAVSTGDTMVLDSTTAEEFTVQALDVVNGMVVGVPALASGDFSTWAAAKSELAKANTDDVTWDPAQDAWTFSYAGPLMEVEPPNYWNFSLALWVQYRNVEGPMQFALGATEMEIRYSTGMDMHMVDNEGSADMAYDMNARMVVSYLGGGEAYRVVGNGDTVVEIAQVSPQGSESGRFSMAWELDVITSDAGCPEGTATVTTQQFRMDAIYDGQGNVNWTLIGPNYQAAGTETMACGSPAF